MRVQTNIHSHTDIGVSHHILNYLDIQICLRHTGTCDMPQDVSGNMRHLLRLPFFLIVGLYNITQDEIDGAWQHGASASAYKDELRKAVSLNVPGNPKLEIQLSLGLKDFPHHLTHKNTPDPQPASSAKSYGNYSHPSSFYRPAGDPWKPSFFSCPHLSMRIQPVPRTEVRCQS